MIKSSAFGGMYLDGDDADRFVRHVLENAANPNAIQALKRGREVLRHASLARRRGRAESLPCLRQSAEDFPGR